jgi:serine/threonine-protein kinase
VALKVIAADVASQPDRLDRFRREARALAALDHPNIVTVFSVEESDGVHFLTMQLVEGESLDRVIPTGGMPIDRLLHVGGAVADALAAAHDKGIVHRDLKPANVMVTADRRVKVLDFGLAKAIDPGVGSREPGVGTASSPTITTPAMTRAGMILGTPAYMSPEQVTGRPVDARTDVFALGILLHEMATGERPFTGETSIELASAILRDTPSPLTDLRPDLPDQLGRLVRRCLEKDPRQRIQTARDVANECSELASAARSVGRPSRPASGAPSPLAAPTPAARASAALPSIAVLPFTNMSADPAQEYFSDGLAEEIINLLAQVPGLKVIARASAFAFRGDPDLRKIAGTLGVRTVLHGSVRQSGSRCRVTAQLIDAADAATLWSERFDRELTDVFAIQDEIGRAISGALQVRLAPPARAVNIEAYQCYLKGRHALLKLRPETMARSREYFEQALAVDSDYAPAHCALAEYHHVLYILGVEPVEAKAPLVRAAAERALAIDPDQCDAHSTLGALADSVDHDWPRAETHHHQALAINAAWPLARFRLAAWHLLPLGRVDEGRKHVRVGLEIDPLSASLHYGLVMCEYAARAYEEAIACARTGLEIDPEFYPFWTTRGHAELHLGRTADAVASMSRAVDAAPWLHSAVYALAAASHAAGDLPRSRELAGQLAGQHAETYGAALYYAVTGDRDALFRALEGAYRQREVFFPVGMQGEALLDPYRADPRFQSLLRRIKLA